MRICFYANMSGHANWREMFDRIEFYRVDIALLRELGHDVVVAGRPAALDRNADLYFCWWWGHSPAPLLLGKLRRRPVIITGAFDYAACRDEIPGKCYLDRPVWQKAILRGALRVADANLFISRAEFDEVTLALPVRNPICAPLAIDTDVYQPRDHVGSRNFFFSVAWSDGINALRKGMPQTLEAFARVAGRYPHMQLKLAGKHGNYQPLLAARAQELGIGDRVTFPGLIDDAAKLDGYHTCAAYVQPTLYEGFGHAIAEAVSSGAHVITASRGAVPEVAGNHAICVNPHDIDAIANSMAHCIENPRTAAEAEAAHRWIVKNYALAIRRDRLRTVLASLT